MEDDKYQYTEEDVEVALRFLRLQLPAYATPENAVKVLVYCHEQMISLEDFSAKSAEKVLLDLESH